MSSTGFQPYRGNQVVSIRDLKPDAQNRRLHNARNLALIQQALERVGPARSIVVDEDLDILAGNGTVQAAIQAGITKVQIVPVPPDTLLAAQVTGLDPEEQRFLGLADNRASELASWDVEQLLADVEEGQDFSGLFSTVELGQLLQEVASPNDPLAAWEGMPSYTSEDQTAAVRVVIHLRAAEDLPALEHLLGQHIPRNTKAIWFPAQAPLSMKQQAYVAQEQD